MQFSRTARLALCAGIFVACAPVTSFAQVFQLPAAFDMKPAGTSTIPGRVAVNASTIYGVSGDYGFSVAPLDARFGDRPAHDVVDRDDDDRPIVRGCVRVASGTEFVCYVQPNQIVRARVLLAHQPFYYKPGTVKYDAFPTALYGLSVLCSEGSALKTVASKIDLRTPVTKAKLETDLGSYRKVWFTGKADANGQLRIQFTSSTGSLVPVSGIELYPYVALPITYKRQGSTWLSSTSGSIPGLAEFHARDFATAHQKFLTITDPLTRATALLWLAGWLEGSAEGYSSALTEAASALSSPLLASNPRAFELRDRLADFRLAELHFSLRNYEKATNLPPSGLGYFNPDYPGAAFAVMPGDTGNAHRHFYLAETLYYQVSGSQSLEPISQWNGNSNPDARFEVFPLAFRALDRIARMYYAMNSLHGYFAGTQIDPGSLAAIELYEKIWSDFDLGGFRANEFNGCSELDVACWIASNASHDHGSNGGVWTNYDGSSIPSTYFASSEAWWTPLVVPSPPPPAAPIWAVEQRRYLTAYRSALAWWISHRAEDGEFGGGDGDDSELVALLHGPLAALRQPLDPLFRNELLRSCDRSLEGPNVADGYYSGPPVDVEHSAEFTSYPIRVALALGPGDPHYLQSALDVSKHVAYPGNSEFAWTDTDGSGQRVFKSFYFNHEGPPSTEEAPSPNVFVDVPLNGKALVPTFQWLRHAHDPMVADLVTDWAANWRTAALLPALDRPLGLAPASLKLNNASTGAPWWQAAPGVMSSYDFPANRSSLRYLHSAASLLAWEQGGANAYQNLVPMIELLRGVLDLEATLAAGGTPSGINTFGSKNWALDQLRNDSDFLDDVATMKQAIATDPQLRVIDDPYQAGSAPYVDTTFMSALDDYLSNHGFGYLTHLAVAQTGPNPLLGQYSRKGKSQLIDQLQTGANWLAHYFPLATTHALYTDRAFVFTGISHQVLHGMFTGDVIASPLPQPIVTWETPASASSPLDIAILVNDLAVKENTTNTRLRVLLYNFEGTARSVDFRLWNRLPPGKYTMRVGAADSETDYFAGPFSAWPVDLAVPGTKYTITVPAQELTLLEIEWFAALPAASGFDLAVSDKDTQASIRGDAGSGFTLSVTTQIGNASSAPAPGGTARLFTSLYTPGGTPLPLNALGATEVELPLTMNHSPLPGVSSYAIPTSAASLALPLPTTVIALLAQGYFLRFRFLVSTGNDLHPHNDIATTFLEL